MDPSMWMICLTCHTRVHREDWEKHRDWHYEKRDAMMAMTERLRQDYLAADRLINDMATYRG